MVERISHIIYGGKGPQNVIAKVPLTQTVCGGEIAFGLPFFARMLVLNFSGWPHSLDNMFQV